MKKEMTLKVQLIVYFLSIFFGIGFPYIFIAIPTWEFNPGNWNWFLRLLCLIIGIFLSRKIYEQAVKNSKTTINESSTNYQHN